MNNNNNNNNNNINNLETTFIARIDDNTNAVYRYRIYPSNNLEGIINDFRTLIIQSYNDLFGMDNNDLTLDEMNELFIHAKRDQNRLPPGVLNNDNAINEFINNNRGFVLARTLLNLNHDPVIQPIHYILDDVEVDDEQLNYYAHYERETEEYFRVFLIFLSFQLIFDPPFEFPNINNNRALFFMNEIIRNFNIIEDYISFYFRDPNARVILGHMMVNFPGFNGDLAQDDFILNQEVEITNDLNEELEYFLRTFHHIKCLNYYHFENINNFINLNNFNPISLLPDHAGSDIEEDNPRDDQEHNLNDYFQRETENPNHRDPFFTINENIENIENNSDYNGIVAVEANINNFVFNNEEQRNNYVQLFNYLRNQINGVDEINLINANINSNIMNNNNQIRNDYNNHRLKYYDLYNKIFRNVAYDLNNYEIMHFNPIFDITYLNDENFTRTVKKSFVLYYLMFIISTCDEVINIYELLRDYYKFFENGIFIFEFMNNDIRNNFKYGEGLYIGLIFYIYAVYGQLPRSYLELTINNMIKYCFTNVNHYQETISTFRLDLNSTAEPNIPYYNYDANNNLYICHYTENMYIESIFPLINNNTRGLKDDFQNVTFYRTLFANFDIDFSIMRPEWNYYRKFYKNITCNTIPQNEINRLSNINIVGIIRGILNDGNRALTNGRFILLSKILYLIYQFAKDNCGCPNIVFDMRIFRTLTTLSGINNDTFLLKNISVYGRLTTGNPLQNEFPRFIKLMSLTEIEKYIITLKLAINNSVPFYVNILFPSENNNNQFTSCIIPINRLSTHFLTAAFLNNQNQGFENINTIEYYKAVKANSSLFYAFGMRSIVGIQLDMECFRGENRAEIYGAYLPIKLKGYNVILNEFSYYTQIYKPDEKADQKYNCFYWAVHINNYYGKNKGIFDDKELVNIYYNYGKGIITLEKIKQFHNEYKVNIRIKRINYVLGGFKNEKSVKSDYLLFNKEYQRELIIGHIKYETFNHFFAIVPIKITKFCCNHLNLLNSEYYDIRSCSGCEIENYEIKTKGRIERTSMNEYYADTYKLFKSLLKQDLTEFVSAYEMEEFMNNINEVKPNINMIIKYPQVQTKIIDNKTEDPKIRESKRKSKSIIAAGDTETYVNKNNVLVPFCLCLVYNDNKGEIIKKSFYGSSCQREFINYLYDNKIREVYFHNLKFDGWLFKDFQIVDMVYHACRLYRLCILVGDKEKKKIYFKDSLALIPTKLKNFPRMFKLNDMEKELYPYNKINEDVINNNDLSIDDCKSEFNNQDFNDFKNMLKNKEFINNDKIDIKSLTEYYCIRDCEILYYGLKKFEEMSMNLFDNINGLRFLTISSLSYYIMTEQSFSDLPSYCGDVKKFIRLAIRGGRCMVANNKKYKINEDIVDFDACSLYPSAMSRLYLPKGQVYGCKDKNQIKIIYKCLMDEDQVIKSSTKFISAMIIKCKILKVGKNRSFPLLSYVENNLTNYTNDMIGKEVYLTHIELQDFIKYQEGEVEMLECIYWAGDKDTRMAEKIKYYYDLRAQYKKEGNQLQEVLKLFMNSSYGKTIQKDTETEDRIFNKIDTDRFLKNNYGRIKEVIEINKKSYWIKLDGSSTTSYIPVQIGCFILGMSKRIMNEVICTAEDNNIDVYYQDTDSIHIKKKDVESLAKAFEASFGRELIGVEMGQFHVDFPLINNKETWSKKSIFLGKKCYIDCLTNIDGEEEDFIRMKGVPEKVIRNTAKDMEIQLYDLYNKMYDGEEISFDLLNSNMPSFEYQKNFGIKLREEFKRILKFK